MDIAHTPAAERIARVLCGQRLSANAGGDAESAGRLVDDHWREHMTDALAVLRTLREPDQAMADAGDPAIWEKMILVAVEAAKPPKVTL
ncbi:hypothetical protein ACFX59_10990 [Sphingomonas sp. NCPPB 2930]|uniref:hypothetical protein n=1 Tax=Sphingomonas sp. NCPPB 2930 TaxID=3162788 RepID=UPI0036DD3557